MSYQNFVQGNVLFVCNAVMMSYQTMCRRASLAVASIALKMSLVRHRMENCFQLLFLSDSFISSLLLTSCDLPFPSKRLCNVLKQARTKYFLHPIRFIIHIQLMFRFCVTITFREQAFLRIHYFSANRNMFHTRALTIISIQGTKPTNARV